MDILVEAQNLLQRFQHGTAFRRYVRERLPFVLPVVAVFVAFSVTTAAGTVIALGGTHSFLVLLAMLAAPFLMLGSLFVQVFVFFFWLENRAIARASGRRPRTAQEELAVSFAGYRAVVGGFAPPVQAIGAALLLAPLALLAVVSVSLAALLLASLVLAPAAYALLDR